MKHYMRADDGTITTTEDTIEWATWLGGANRSIDRSIIGDVLVSTVFLGVDHNFGGGVPILFETMAFGPDGALDFCLRYPDEDRARRGHTLAVDRLRRGLSLEGEWQITPAEDRS